MWGYVFKSNGKETLKKFEKASSLITMIVQNDIK